jgi:hypothetical protein
VESEKNISSTQKQDIREESLPTNYDTFLSVLADYGIVMPVQREFFGKLEWNYPGYDIGYNAVQRALTANPKIQ